MGENNRHYEIVLSVIIIVFITEKVFNKQRVSCLKKNTNMWYYNDEEIK